MQKGYDYIIVGAGTAGCVLAHRLSEGGAVIHDDEGRGRGFLRSA